MQFGGAAHPAESTRLGRGERQRQTGHSATAPQVKMGSQGRGKKREKGSAVGQVLVDGAGSKEAPGAGLLKNADQLFLSR